MLWSESKEIIRFFFYTITKRNIIRIKRNVKILYSRHLFFPMQLFAKLVASTSENSKMTTKMFFYLFN